MKFLSVLFVLATTLVSSHTFAQGSGSVAPSGPPAVYEESTFYEPEIPSNDAFDVRRQAKGSLVSIDDNFLTIKTKRNKLITIRLTDDTSYKEGKKTTALKDLLEGQVLKVTYKPEESAAIVDKAVSVKILAQPRPLLSEEIPQ